MTESWRVWRLVIVLSVGCGGGGEGASPAGCDTSAPAHASCDVFAGPNIGLQGPLVATGISTDLALEGPGFFAVDPGSTGAPGPWLTRAGRFTTDKDGFLVTLQSHRVLGMNGPLQLGNMTRAPIPTSSCTLAGNLDANAPIAPIPFSPTDLRSYSVKTEFFVYDSLGTEHALTIYFVSTAPGQWDYHATCDGAEVTGGLAGTPVDVADGSLTFGSRGEFTSGAQTSSNFNPTGAINPQPLDLNLSGMTQFADASGITFSEQDGSPAATRVALAIGLNGDIVASFSDGGSRSVGQLEVARVPAPDWLTLVGDHLYATSGQSGEAVVGQPCVSGLSCVLGGSYESLAPDPTGCTAAP